MNKTAIVVGSGFGGISAALRLKSLGYEVSIYEKLNQLGGRARVFKKSGFTFDAGPTVITAPFLFNELFELFKKNREKYVKFVELDPWYRFYFSSNKKIFDYSKSLKRTEKEISKTKGNKTETASLVGKKLAEKAASKGIKQVSFDRSGYLYHGRVKSLADGAREGGLKF